MNKVWKICVFVSFFVISQFFVNFETDNEDLYESSNMGLEYYRKNVKKEKK